MDNKLREAVNNSIKEHEKVILKLALEGHKYIVKKSKLEVGEHSANETVVYYGCTNETDLREYKRQGYEVFELEPVRKYSEGNLMDWVQAVNKVVDFKTAQLERTARAGGEDKEVKGCTCSLCLHYGDGTCYRAGAEFNIQKEPNDTCKHFVGYWNT